MAFATITWVSRPNYEDAGLPMGLQESDEELAVSASQATSEAAPAQSVGVRIASDVAIRIVIADAPVVTATSGMFLPAGGVEYFRVTDGTSKVAVIQSS
jgi:hypothetical protein